MMYLLHHMGYEDDELQGNPLDTTTDALRQVENTARKAKNAKDNIDSIRNKATDSNKKNPDSEKSNSKSKNEAPNKRNNGGKRNTPNGNGAKKAGQIGKDATDGVKGAAEAAKVAANAAKGAAAASNPATAALHAATKVLKKIKDVTSKSGGAEAPKKHIAVKAAIAGFMAPLLLSCMLFITILSPAALIIINAEQAIEEFMDDPLGFIADNVKSFFGKIGDFFAGKDEEDEESTELVVYTVDGEDITVGDYGDPQLYCDAYLANKELIDKAFEKAYKKKLKEIKKKCADDGYTYSTTKKNLKNTGSGSWEDVFSQANYGALIIAFSIGKYGTNINDFDNEDFVNTLTSDEALDKLIRIEYDDVTEEDAIAAIVEIADLLKSELEEYNTALDQWKADANRTEDSKPKPGDYHLTDKTIQATMHPYAWADLFEIVGTTADATYSGDITNNDMKDNMLESMKASVSKEYREDLDMSLYDYLQLDNDISWSNYYNGVTTSDGLVTLESLNLGLFGTDEWYSGIPSYSTLGTQVETFDSWLALYDGPTVEASDDSYYVNTPVIQTDVYNNIVSIVGSQKNSLNLRNWCSREFSELKTLQGVKWEGGSGGCAIVNGRYPIAVGPGVVSKNYYSATNGVTNSSSWYSYGSRRMDLILQDNDTKVIYYVPVTTGDSKGHTYPFGVVQTGIHTPDKESESITGSDFATDFAITDLGTALDQASVLTTYNSKLLDVTGKYDISQWLAGGPVEWCCPGFGSTTANNRISSLKNRFTLLGINVYD